MADLEINLRVTPGIFRWGAVGFLLCGFAAELNTESFTMTTTYPAPFAAYAKMITTQDAYLARDSGAVGIGTPSPAPGVKLDVNGAARIGGNLSSGGISPAGDISAGHITAAGVSVSAPGDVKVNGQSVITKLNCINGIICSPGPGNNTWTITKTP